MTPLPTLAIMFRKFYFPDPKDCKIICLTNLLTLSVPDESYSRNAHRALNYISTSLMYISREISFQIYFEIHFVISL